MLRLTNCLFLVGMTFLVTGCAVSGPGNANDSGGNANLNANDSGGNTNANINISDGGTTVGGVTVNAGPDETVAPGGLLQLSGSVAGFPSGEALTYTWVQISGATANVTGMGISSISFFAPLVVGVLEFDLTVESAGGTIVTDSVVVTVAGP